MVVFIGPVFFTLIQATFQHGFGSGWAVAWGIIVSDVICVWLSKLGVDKFIQNDAYKMYIGIAGALMLIGIGSNYAFNPKASEPKAIVLTAKDYVGFFTKGFLVNFVNPFVFIVWMGVYSAALSQYSGNEVNVFLVAVLGGIFFTDTLKAVFAHKIKAYLNPMALKKLYKSIGILLIVFGGILAWRVLL